jgi:hypothetical protein
MTSTPRLDPIHQSLQQALTLIEAKVEGRRANLDWELVHWELLASALITIAASMAKSHDQPVADVIENLRMQALTTAKY